MFFSSTCSTSCRNWSIFYFLTCIYTVWSVITGSVGKQGWLMVWPENKNLKPLMEKMHIPWRKQVKNESVFSSGCQLQGWSFPQHHHCSVNWSMLLEFRLFVELHCWHTHQHQCNQTGTLSLSYANPSDKEEWNKSFSTAKGQGSFMDAKAVGSHSPLFTEIPPADPIFPVVKSKILLFSYC